MTYDRHGRLPLGRPAHTDSGARIITGDDGLLELDWPDGAATVPITRAGLQSLVDAINQMRRLTRPPAAERPVEVDPDQLTIYDEADE